MIQSSEAVLALPVVGFLPPRQTGPPQNDAIFSELVTRAHFPILAPGLTIHTRS